MNFAYLHIAGLAAFVAAAVCAGGDGLPYLLAAVVSLPLAWLQRSVVGMARDDQDARNTHALTLLLQLAVALVLVWMLPMAGTVLFAAGGVLNVTVLFANGLRMPVTRPITHPCYCEIGPTTRWPWLGDIFAASRTAKTLWMFSLGDILEMLSLWAVAAHLTVRLVA